jgi:hypothetical protein
VFSLQAASRIVWRALAILGAALLLALAISPHFFQAAEDAIILFQYSVNLAHTGVISFVPNGPRVEGATDFLWMAYLAGGKLLGIDCYWLAVLTSAASAVLLAIVLLRLAKQPVRPWDVLALSALVLLTPQVFAAAAGFSVFPFALLTAIMAWQVLEGRFARASFAALLLCLFRPDGVVFAVPLLTAFLFRDGEWKRNLRQVAVWFIAPGCVYFAWRWHYFGHFLPLPFYVKSDTARLWGFLVPQSAIKLLPPLAVAMFLIVWGLRSRAKSRPVLVLLAALVFVPSVFYIALRLDQNIANRFFLYPLVGAAVILAWEWESVRARAGKLLLAGMSAWACVLAFFWVNSADIFLLGNEPHIIAVAQEISALPGPRRMIVTETGAIPYYSRWTAYDPWGLNDPAFAQRLVRPEDVARLHPDLLIIHPDEQGPEPCELEAGWTTPYTARTWRHMVENLIAGVGADYEQWMVPEYSDYYRADPTEWNGRPRPGIWDYQCWFVRKDYPSRGQVETILKRHGAMTPAAFLAARIAYYDNAAQHRPKSFSLP